MAADRCLRALRQNTASASAARASAASAASRSRMSALRLGEPEQAGLRR